jgi:hypothetical protein
MVLPTITQELLRAREADLARELRHVTHTRDARRPVLSAALVRAHDLLFTRDSRRRSVAAPHKLGSAADAVDEARFLRSRA